MENIHKLKNLLVSSCQSIKEGNRDIGINLLEIAADLMEAEDISPEVIETQFVTAVNDNSTPTEFEAASEDSDDNNQEETDKVVPVLEDSTNDIENESEDKSVDVITEQASHKSLRDILSNWGITNVNAKTA